MSQSSNENQGKVESRPTSQASNRPPSQASRPASQAYNNSTPNHSRPASRAQANQSRPTSQASNNPTPNQTRPASRTQANQSRPTSQPNSRPASQASQSRTSSPSVSRTRPPRTPRGRSRTPRSISSAGGSDEDEAVAAAQRSSTPTVENPEPDSELPDVNEEDEEDGAGKDQGENEKGGDTKKKRRRRGKKRGFGVDQWPHGDNPGFMERPHGVNDWPHVDEEGEGVGTSGRVLQRPKGVRDFSPAYAPSDAGSNSSRWTDRTDYSQVSGLSLGNWGSSLPGVDNWPHGDNPGIMVKPLDHFGNPLKNPDGTLMQKENPTGLPTYEELRDMDLDTHDDHVIALKLEIDIDVAVEINARIHGDVTLALLM
ncbi:hypothetical protein BT96DRAFT_391484 [Gymnopus androsaceus JB14]|uniref:Uncharacterized protein n=1 Tax=Gymnopus androsaceus JB14 TaxID=1447944 RepID=A0A6A4GW74_9AGAR|nr:hypothetical protein BT96DRAFT_391484 [Gymnopus androsaceus JB14]